MEIRVLYEDDNFLAIDKPAGISVHPALKEDDPSGRTKEYTVTDWVLENYPDMKGVGEPLGEIERPGVVHRLDRDTSGVLILTKNQESHQFLKKQFQDRLVKKVYHTIVTGFVKNDRGTIDKAIGRSPRDFRRRLAGRGARGELREALTEYRVLKRFRVGDPLIKYSYLEIRPKTGRTHQIRVHMKYLNHPVVCDALYNPTGPRPEGVESMALHAKSIQWTLPSGEAVKVESPLPASFEALLNEA